MEQLQVRALKKLEPKEAIASEMNSQEAWLAPGSLITHYTGTLTQLTLPLLALCRGITGGIKPGDAPSRSWVPFGQLAFKCAHSFRYTQLLSLSTPLLQQLYKQTFLIWELGCLGS